MFVDARALQPLDVGDLDTLDQLHRQHAPRRELAIDLGHQHGGVSCEVMAHGRRVLRLVNEVQFHRHVLQSLAHQDAIVEVALEHRQPSQHQRHVAEVGAHYPVDSRILHLHRASTPVMQPCTMHLRERRRRQRDRIELGVNVLQRATQFAFDLIANHRKRPRRNPIVQSRQRRHPFVGQHVRASRDKLACLDQQAFQPQRGAVQRLRGAQILPPIKLGLVEIADEACPELRAFVARVHIGGQPHDVGKTPRPRGKPRLGHVGGEVKTAVESRIDHTERCVRSDVT